MTVVVIGVIKMRVRCIRLWHAQFHMQREGQNEENAMQEETKCRNLGIGKVCLLKLDKARIFDAIHY